MTKDQIRADVDALPANYKTADVDRLISRYVKEKADVSCLRHEAFHQLFRRYI